MGRSTDPPIPLIRALLTVHFFPMLGFQVGE
jgi:hypothetical protein